jgi:hypothetical protein
VLIGQIQTTEVFTLAGRFSPTTLVIGGLMLLGVVAALTWWELRRARPWLVPVFVALRAAALAIVLWMLAEPVLQTTVKRTQPKTVAFMADASESMGLVDPVQDESDIARWTLAQGDTNQSDVLAALDGAAFELRRVRDLFAQCVEIQGKPGQGKPTRELAARLQGGAKSADGQIETCVVQMIGGKDAFGEELAKLRSTWKDSALPQVQQFAEDLKQGDLASSIRPDGQARQASQLLDQLAAQMGGLADRYAVDVSRQPDAAVRASVQQYARRTRGDRLAGLLDRLESTRLLKIEKRADVLRYEFDSQVFSLSKRTWAEGLAAPRRESQQHTDLSAALAQIEQDSTGRMLAGVVLLTDGAHNAEGDPLKKAAALAGTPLYIVPVGNLKPVRDVMIHHAQGPRSVYQNNLVVIEAMLDAHECQMEQVQVELIENGEKVDEQTVAITSSSFFTPLTFKRKAERLGLNEYQIRVAPVVDEQNTENNQASLKVEVTEGKIRVFLADQLPRWEFRYLRNLFKRDSRVEFESLQLEPASATGRPGEGVQIPNTTDEWSRYRVVILGDITPSFLTRARQQQLKDFVSLRGGTLVIIAGDVAMPSAYIDGPLGPALPVDSARNPLAEGRTFHVVVSPEGRTVPVTQLADDPSTSDQLWRDQLDDQRLSVYSLPKPTSHVWLAALPGSAANPTGNEMSAFLCWQKYGKGRVLYLAAPITWRLRLRCGDEYHGRFWRQLQLWAISREIGSGSTTVRLVTDKTHYQSGEDVPVNVHLSHPNGQAVSQARIDIVAGSHEQTRASVPAEEDRETPGLYHATLKQLPVGNVTIRADGAAIQALLSEEKYEEPIETQVVVEPPLSLELRDTRCNLPLLTQMAAATGGAVVPPTALSTALAGLDLTPRVTEEVRRQALWPRWACLAVFLGSLSVEWVVRKLLGMA